MMLLPGPCLKTSCRCTLGMKPLSIISFKGQPGATGGSWSGSPTNMMRAPGLVFEWRGKELMNAAAKGQSQVTHVHVCIALTHAHAHMLISVLTCSARLCARKRARIHIHARVCAHKHSQPKLPHKQSKLKLPTAAG